MQKYKQESTYRTVPVLNIELSTFRRYVTVRTYGIVRYNTIRHSKYANRTRTVKHGTVRYRTCSERLCIVDPKMPSWHHAIKYCLKPEIHM